jgi:hypothetical protein
MLIILTGLSVHVINEVSEMETSGSHGGEYEDDSLLGKISV